MTSFLVVPVASPGFIGPAPVVLEPLRPGGLVVLKHKPAAYRARDSDRTLAKKCASLGYRIRDPTGIF